MKSEKRLTAALLAALLALSLTACGGESLGQKIGENVPPETTAGTETTDAAVPAESTGPEEKDGAGEALALLRRCMEPVPRIALAAAYLGNRSGEDTMPLSNWLWETVPGLMEQMPFIGEIPEDRILGGGYGDLYCLVPRDDSTTLAVNWVHWDRSGGEGKPQVEEVLYRSEYAEPVLVYVWYEGALDAPLIEIQAIAGNGAQVTWYPTLDRESGYCIVPTGENDVPLVLDFSFFAFLDEEGNDMEDGDFGDDGWLPPTNEGLADTNWVCEEWSLELFRGSEDPGWFGTAELCRWSAGVAGADETRDGFWRMEGDCLCLEFPGVSGGSFPVLVDPSGEHLFIRQAADGACPPFFDEDMASMELTLSYG